MSRSGYSEDYGDDDPLAMGRYRQAVQRAMDGKRGQALLRELADTLDAMPVKRLYCGNFATAEGEFCTLGALGARRGTKMDDLGGDDYCDTALVGERFGIARSMAAEIMYENDEGAYRSETPEQRWTRVREWVRESLKTIPPKRKQFE